MRVLLQRISEAWVEINGASGSRAGAGLLALVGFQRGDHERMLDPMAAKVANMRIFEDEDGRMNRSLLDCKGDLVVVPQFTLYADCRKGRRPAFSGALESDPAAMLFEQFCRVCGEFVPEVIRGTFGAEMMVHLVNDGPVTILLNSEELNLG